MDWLPAEGKSPAAWATTGGRSMVRRVEVRTSGPRPVSWSHPGVPSSLAWRPGPGPPVRRRSTAGRRGSRSAAHRLERDQGSRLHAASIAAVSRPNRHDHGGRRGPAQALVGRLGERGSELRSRGQLDAPRVRTGRGAVAHRANRGPRPTGRPSLERDGANRHGVERETGVRRVVGDLERRRQRHGATRGDRRGARGEGQGRDEIEAGRVPRTRATGN